MADDTEPMVGTIDPDKGVYYGAGQWLSAGQVLIRSIDVIIANTKGDPPSPEDTGMSYADYLAGVNRQRERDADRYHGRDSHADQPAYDQSTGKVINRPQPTRVHLEVNADGRVIVKGFHIADAGEWREMSEAMADVGLRVFLRRTRDVTAEQIQEAIDSGRLRRIREAERRAAEVERYNREHPYICECADRFKTALGLNQHRSRARQHKGRPSV